MTNAVSVIYFILVFGSIFTSFFTMEYFGYFGRALLNIVIPALAVVGLPLFKTIKLNTFLRRMLQLSAYLIAVTLISLLWWFLSGNGLYNSGGVNVIVKALTEYAYWINIVLYVILFYNCLRELKIESIFKPFVFTFSFLFLWLIIELLTMPYAFPWYHNVASNSNMTDPTFYDRVRLTTTESSTSVPLIVVFGLASFYYYQYIKKNRKKAVIIVAMITVFIATSGSKTLLLLLPCLFLVFIRWTIIKKRYLFLFLAIVAFLIALLYSASELVELSATESSTFAGRTASVLAALTHMIKYPFGAGTGTYTESFGTELVTASSIIGSYEIASSWDFSSLLKAASEGEATAISGIFTLSLYWGIAGTVIFIITLVKQFKSYAVAIKGVFWLNLLYIFIVYLWLTTISYSNYYICWAAIVLVGYLKGYFYRLLRSPQSITVSKI